MAVQVVHALEIVHVADDQAHVVAEAIGFGHRARQRLVERATIRETGQRIGPCPARRLLDLPHRLE